MEINQENFVLFRLPNQNSIELWKISEQKTDSKFTFHSFDNTQHLELYAQEKLNLDLNDLDSLSIQIHYKSLKEFPYCLSKSEYLEKAEDFISKLKNKEFNKIILSRVKSAPGIEKLSIKFKALCKKYPTAWIYLFHYNQETWLGASPERLLQSTPNGYKTVALAATKSKQESREWTDKEFKEHDLVVQYISSKFNPDSIQKNGPYTIDLGEIQHLKTDIHMTDASLNLNDILLNIHPTPAVCGMPKEKTKDYILNHEGYSRSFYTGYFGIETPNHSEFYVNLRCAQLFQNKTALYVGGGLLAESNAESEWSETELKSKALL